jgi:hypothetical protein
VDCFGGIFLDFEDSGGMVVLYYGWYMVQVEKSVG